MTSEKDTPLPYGMEVTDTDIWIGRMQKNGRKVDEIAIRLDYDPTYKQKVRTQILANAEFIVRAINSHYELLHWVKLMLDTPYLNDVGRVSLKKAIAKAEGK